MKNLILLSFALTMLVAACQQQKRTPIFDDGTSKYWKAEQAPFYHGVASGDPLADAVIIWTRITPEWDEAVNGTWSVAADAPMQNVVKTGEFTTDGNQDFTVKVDVQGLEADTYYYYQFEAQGKKSPVGRTKTAVSGSTDQVRFAVVSCSNFEAGYFNAFGRIAELEDLEAVLHLGDYIYETAVVKSGGHDLVIE